MSKRGLAVLVNGATLRIKGLLIVLLLSVCAIIATFTLAGCGSALIEPLETHTHGSFTYTAPKKWERTDNYWKEAAEWRESGTDMVVHPNKTERFKYLYVCDSDPSICLDVEFVDRSGAFQYDTGHGADQNYYFCYQQKEDFGSQRSREELKVNGIPVIEYLYTREDAAGTILQQTRYFLAYDGWVRVTVWCPESKAQTAWDSLLQLEDSVRYSVV